MPLTNCVFEECAEPAEKTITLAWQDGDRQCELCREHAHDVDWGVISYRELIRNAWLRGLLDPVPSVSSTAGGDRS